MKDIQKVSDGAMQIAYDSVIGQHGNKSEEQWVAIGQIAAVLLKQALSGDEELKSELISRSKKPEPKAKGCTTIPPSKPD